MNDRKLSIKDILNELNENNIEFNLVTKQPQSEFIEAIYLQKSHLNSNNR